MYMLTMFGQLFENMLGYGQIEKSMKPSVLRNLNLYPFKNFFKVL